MSFHYAVTCNLPRKELRSTRLAVNLRESYTTLGLEPLIYVNLRESYTTLELVRTLGLVRTGFSYMTLGFVRTLACKDVVYLI